MSINELKQELEALKEQKNAARWELSAEQYKSPEWIELNKKFRRLVGNYYALERRIWDLEHESHWIYKEPKNQRDEAIRRNIWKNAGTNFIRFSDHARQTKNATM